MTPPVLENAVSSSSMVGGHRGALSRVSPSEQLDDAPLFCFVWCLMKFHTRPCLPRSISPGLSLAAVSEVTLHTEKHSHPPHPLSPLSSPPVQYLVLHKEPCSNVNPPTLHPYPCLSLKPPSEAFSIGRICFIIHYGGSAQQMCTCIYDTKADPGIIDGS